MGSSILGKTTPNDLKNNYTATSAPTVNDDVSLGYQVGSKWYNTTTLQFYVLVDNTDGAAVWVDLTNADDSYQGAWAASTNTPTLADGTGTNGYYYLASDAGSVDFGSGSIAFTAGDMVIYNGSIWQKIEGGVSYVPVNKAGDTMTGNLSVPNITVTQRLTPSTNKETLSANKTLTTSDAQYHFLDPNGSNRDVTMPTEAAGMAYFIKNDGTANTITVKDSGGTAIGDNSLAAGIGVGYLYDGIEWQLV